MAKHQGPKASTVVTTNRSADRKNNKAWGKFHESAEFSRGHRLTGKSKPSGKSVGGHALRKLVGARSEDYVRASRDHAHRSQLRREKKRAAVSAAASNASGKG